MKAAEEVSNLFHKKKLWYGLAVLAALLLLWRLFVALTPAPTPAKEVPLVRTLTVGEELGDGLRVYSGEIRGRRESVLGFQAQGRIASRLVNVGDRVKAGQVLFTLNPQDASALTSAADAAVVSATATQKLAADNVRRYAALLKAGAVSQATFDSYQVQLDNATAQLQEAQALARASHNQLGYTQLISDTEGEVATINAEVGQVVAAGTPVVTVVAAGSLEAQFYLPEKELTSTAPGAPCTVTLWALPELKLAATVKEIATAADNATRTYRVRASLQDPPKEVKVGMTCKVSLPKAGLPQGQAFLLPASALYQVNGRQAVWLVKEGKAHLQEVSCQDYQGNQVAVTAGLAAGDVVITAGLEKLNQGQAVQPARPPKAGE